MQKFNLEKDLIKSDLITQKCKNSEQYCKDLYASLCNMQWCPKQPFEILKEEYWSCSWRYSGGIVATILDDGDYMDWYCSGNEGYVTEEIKEDLETLGWFPVEWPE